MPWDSNYNVIRKVPLPLCKEWHSKMSLTTPRGGARKLIKPGHNYIREETNGVTWIESSIFKTDVSCQGHSYQTSKTNKLEDVMVAEYLDIILDDIEILVTEDGIVTINGGEQTKIDCMYKTGFCVTDTATYTWEVFHPSEKCPFYNDG